MTRLGNMRDFNSTRVSTSNPFGGSQLVGDEYKLPQLDESCGNW